MHFDLATAMLVTSLLTLGVGTILTFAAWHYPPQLRNAMRVWIGGLVLQSLAAFAASTVGQVQMPLVLLVANTAYALALAEMGRALRIFAGQSSSRIAFALIGMVAVITLLFGVVSSDTRWRVALNGLPIAALLFAVALPILRGRSPLRPADYLTGLLFLACGTLSLSRSAVEFLGPSLVPAHAEVLMRQVVLVFGSILPTLGTISFMLMCGDRLNDNLARLAMIDPLTGVYNRRTLATLADTAIRNALRTHSSLALLAIDVDHFKRINDEFGHDTGDEALRGLVSLMQETLRVGDVLSRIGGEEFAVLLPGSGPGEATLAAERVRAHVERSPLLIDGRSLNLRVSIGVAALGPDAADLATLLRNADRALYAAKRGGRNRVADATALVTAPVRLLRDGNT